MFGIPSRVPLLAVALVLAGSATAQAAPCPGAAECPYDGTGQIGLLGADEGVLRQPVDAATLPSGNVLVQEHAVDRIFEFTADGAFVAVRAAPPRRAPGIASDGTNVYYAGAEGGIVKRPLAGGAATTIAPSLQMQGGLAVGTGGHLFVGLGTSVREIDPTGATVRTFGSEGTGNGQFTRIADVAVAPSGRVFALDAGANRVEVFSATGTFSHHVGPGDVVNGGPSPLSGPSRVAVDAMGKLYVTTFNELRRYAVGANSSTVDATAFIPDGRALDALAVNGMGTAVYAGGTPLRRYAAVAGMFSENASFGFPPGGRLFGPNSAAFSPGLGRIYVADTDANRIQAFNFEGGTLADIFPDGHVGGEPGSGPGEFRSPTDIAVSPEERVIVADQGNQRVQVLDAAGAFVAQRNSVPGGGPFNPSAVAAGPDGLILVGDSFANVVHVFDLQNTGGVDELVFVRTVGTPAADPNNPVDGELAGVGGLAFGPDGDILVADRSHHVVRFSPTGTFLGNIGAFGGGGDGTLQLPRGVDYAPDVGIVVSDVTQHVTIYDGDGTFQRAFGGSTTSDQPSSLPGRFAFNEDVDISPGGDLAVTDALAQLVKRFNLVPFVPPAPSATLTPTTWSFGDVAVGTTSPATTFTVTNTGTVALDLQAVTGSARFGVDAGTCLGDPIAPAGTCTVTAAFSPDATGNRTGTLTVTGVDLPAPLVAGLSGTGTQAAPALMGKILLRPDGFDFGAITIGTTSRTFGFELKNVGDGPLRLTSAVRYTGPFVPDPATATTCATGTTLAPQASCAIYPAFRPTADGAATGTLAIDSDDLTSATTTRTLRGTGRVPDPQDGGGGGEGGREVLTFPALDPKFVAAPGPVAFAVAKMPDLRPGSKRCRRLCTVGEARAILDKLGFGGVDIAERNGDVDDVSRKLRERIEDGHVLSTTPKPGTSIQLPNLAANPSAPRPRITLNRYDDPQKPRSCRDDDLEATEGLRKGDPWPGANSGSGIRRRVGGEQYLRRIGCVADVTYKAKSKDVSSMTVDRVRAASSGKVVRVRVTQPASTELLVLPLEDLNSTSVSLNDAGHMPVTRGGRGQLEVMVVQKADGHAVRGARVVITEPDGTPAAISKETNANGIATLDGVFRREGRYPIVAQYVDADGRTLDSNADRTLRVRDQGGNKTFTTASQRTFALTDAGYKRSKAKAARAAQAKKTCTIVVPAPQVPFLDREFVGAILTGQVNAGVALGLLRALLGADDARTRSVLMAELVQHWFEASDAGLLDNFVYRAIIDGAGFSVVNLGIGELDVPRCRALTQADIDRLANGFATTSRPVAGIRLADQLVTPDGSVVFAPGTVELQPAVSRFLNIDATTQMDLFEAHLATADSNVKTLAPPGRSAASGVIASGGGNVIASGGGNVLVPGGIGAKQLRGLYAATTTIGAAIRARGIPGLAPHEDAALDTMNAAVIASGGGNVIASGGGNVIASGGGNLVDLFRSGLTAIAGGASVIASGGGNVIASGGGNLTAADEAARQAAKASVIAGGGGNVIASGGGNVIASGGGNVIASGGGNVVTPAIAERALTMVVAAEGGQITDLLRQGNAAVIASGGGNVIASGGGNVIASGGGNVIASGGGNVLRNAIGQLLGSRGSSLGLDIVSRLRNADLQLQKALATGLTSAIPPGSLALAPSFDRFAGLSAAKLDLDKVQSVIASGGGN